MNSALFLPALIFLLMLIGIPVYVVFGVTAVLITLIFGYSPCLIVPTMFTNLNSFVLMAIPFFILAGNFMAISGIADRLTEFAGLFIGRLKGGLGIITVISSGLFGAITGSSASTIATIGAVMLPQMEMNGYKKEYATALVACSGVIGQLIPPSIPMILFGMVTKTSIIGCFLATAVPGIMIIISYSVINFFWCRKNMDSESYQIVVDNNRSYVGSFRINLNRYFWPMILPITILGGIYSGIFTPTEAGCLAVLYSILFGVINRKISLLNFSKAIKEAVSITGTVILIVAFITVVGRIITYERIPETLAMRILNVTSNKIYLLLLINLFILVVGMIMDDISAILIMAPLLCPLFAQLGIEPLQVAAILAVNQGSGQITPPVATNLFTASRVSGVSVPSIFKYCLPFLVFGSLPTLLLVTFIPGVSLWLPQLLMR